MVGPSAPAHATVLMRNVIPGQTVHIRKTAPGPRTPAFLTEPGLWAFVRETRSYLRLDGRIYTVLTLIVDGRKTTLSAFGDDVIEAR